MQFCTFPKIKTRKFGERLHQAEKIIGRAQLVTVERGLDLVDGQDDRSRQGNATGQQA